MASEVSSHIRARQNRVLKCMRENGYVLGVALEKAKVPMTSFRRWYLTDEVFQERFDALEAEQIVFLRQTLRELASGLHPSCEGKPDKTMLRFLINEYAGRQTGAIDTEGLGEDLEEMSERDLQRILDGE